MKPPSPHPRSLRVAVVLAAALTALLVGAWATRRPTDQTRGTALGGHPSGSRDSAFRPRPGAPSRAVGASDRDGEGRAPLDCARPVGDAARVDEAGISAEALCARVARMGGPGADRGHMRVVLDQLIDAELVRRALAWEHQTVSEAELGAALAAMPSSPSTDDGLLREQTREVLELRRLVAARNPLAVSEQEVDAEVAAGATGIDRDRAVRVEAWIARTAPGDDGGTTAREAATAFALGVQTADPEVAGARHRLTRLAPFVIQRNGVEPDLERAAFTLTPGRWSDAIPTRVGWVVLRPVDRVEGEEPSPDVLRTRVRRALEGRKLEAARRTLIADLRSASRVELLVSP